MDAPLSTWDWPQPDFLAAMLDALLEFWRWVGSDLIAELIVSLAGGLIAVWLSAHIKKRAQVARPARAHKATYVFQALVGEIPV